MARVIANLMVLIAVLLMPLGMSVAPAAAAHHSPSASMPMKHCPEQAPSHGAKAGFDECMMACSAALPAIDLAQERHIQVTSTPTAPVTVQMLDGVHPDTATPPPKAS